MSTTTKKQEGGRVVGFSVSDEDYDALQNYANIFAKTLQLDPKTGKPITNEAGKPVMMIESPYIGLLIKVATSAYIMGAELFKQQLVQYQQQHNNNSNNNTNNYSISNKGQHRYPKIRERKFRSRSQNLDVL